PQLLDPVTVELPRLAAAPERVELDQGDGVRRTDPGHRRPRPAPGPAHRGPGLRRRARAAAAGAGQRRPRAAPRRAAVGTGSLRLGRACPARATHSRAVPLGATATPRSYACPPTATEEEETQPWPSKTSFRNHASP